MEKINFLLVFYINRLSFSLKKIGGLETNFAASLLGMMSISFYFFSIILIVSSLFDLTIKLGPTASMVIGFVIWIYILYQQKKSINSEAYKVKEEEWVIIRKNFHVYFFFCSFLLLIIGLLVIAYV